MKGAWKLLSLFFVVFIALFLYTVFISFSESRSYGKLSLDYWVLSPDVLRQLSGSCRSSPQFRYSAADGPKPAIIIMSCSVPKSSFLEVMEEAGFQQVDAEKYESGRTQVMASTTGRENLEGVIVFEHL